MSIIIRKKDTGELFDIPPRFALEINNTSAFFNELGSKTVSTSLPFTNVNIRLMGFSNCLETTSKPPSKIDVIVSSGAYYRSGVLYRSNSYNTESTFGITIAFNEGIMYEGMEDLLINKLKNLPLVEKPIEDLVEDMNVLLTGNRADNELSIFSIAFKSHEYTINDDDKRTATPFLNFFNTDIKPIRLLTETTTLVVYKEKLQEIDVPYGYGISPFVRVWKVLELIFDHFGFKIGNNPFKDHYQLNGLCVLNNAIDAITKGQIDYSQLLPSVSVKDFLQALYCRFGLKVFFDGNSNLVNLYLLKDLLNYSEGKPISASSQIDIDDSTPKQIKLSVAKNLDLSSTETDTFEEFTAKYNNTITTHRGSLFTPAIGGIYYYPWHGIFRQFSMVLKEGKVLSSIHFDWNKKTEGIEIEDITSIDECITMRLGSYMPYYGLNPCLINFDMELDGEINDMYSDENKLAFAYDMGEAYGVNSESGKFVYYGYNFGSIFPHVFNQPDIKYQDRQGNIFNYALTLIGEDGAFNRFFKTYDAILRHSNRLVKFSAHLPMTDLSDPNFETPRNLDGQLLLLDKVNHQLGTKHNEAKIEARTTRLYEPYNLDADHYMPTPTPIIYKWELGNDRDVKIEEARQKIITNLKAIFANDPTFILFYVNIYRINDPNPPGKKDYWFLPPTQYQFDKQVKVANTKHTCNVTFLVRHSKQTSDEPVMQNVDVDYSGWYYPVKHNDGL